MKANFVFDKTELWERKKRGTESIDSHGIKL